MCLGTHRHGLTTILFSSWLPLPDNSRSIQVLATSICNIDGGDLLYPLNYLRWEPKLCENIVQIMKRREFVSCISDGRFLSGNKALWLNPPGNQTEANVPSNYSSKFSVTTRIATRSGYSFEVKTKKNGQHPFLLFSLVNINKRIIAWGVA